jgi:hypothetical protein
MLASEKAYFTGFPATLETARWLGFLDSSDLLEHPDGVKSVILSTSQEALAKRLSRL